MKKAVYKAPSDEDPVEAIWEHQEDEDEEQKIFIGKVSLSTIASLTSDNPTDAALLTFTDPHHASVEFLSASRPRA